MNHAGQEDRWIFFFLQGKIDTKKMVKLIKMNNVLIHVIMLMVMVFSLSLTPAEPLQIVTHTASQAQTPTPHSRACCGLCSESPGCHPAPRCSTVSSARLVRNYTTQYKQQTLNQTKFLKLPADKLHIPPLIYLGCLFFATVFTLSKFRIISYDFMVFSFILTANLSQETRQKLLGISVKPVAFSSLKAVHCPGL